MKRVLIISLGLNLALLGMLPLWWRDHQRQSERRSSAELAANAPSSPSVYETVLAKHAEAPPGFHWRQLESTNNYRTYVANLRAIGCPEPTINDIASGDARRAFAFKRAQAGLDGSGQGLWSRSREASLVASLLGKEPAASVALNRANATPLANERTTDPMTATDPFTIQNGNQPANSPSADPRKIEPVYPVAFQKINLEALGFGASEKAAILQVQAQFVNDIGGLDQNPGDPGYLARWQTAQVNADDALRGALGSQAYMAFVQQQYYDWYQPLVQAAEASKQTTVINPALFSVQ